jgi:murein DD-endopeptidase MepM/ murein hydrolase activator NlpD
LDAPVTRPTTRAAPLAPKDPALATTASHSPSADARATDAAKTRLFVSAKPASIARSATVTPSQTSAMPSPPGSRATPPPGKKVDPSPTARREVRGVLGDGTTLLAFLQKAGLPQDDLVALLNAAGKVIDFRRCRSGDRYRLVLGTDGRAERLEYYGARPIVLGAERRRGKLVPLKEPLRGKSDIRVVRGTLTSSLEAAVVGAGGAAPLAARLADLFAWDLDFNVDPRSGDTFSIAVERVLLPDGSWREGAVLGAEYRGHAGTFRAFRFRAGGVDDYYDEAGRSLRRRYLASPLPFVRITSSFGRRWHPILSRMKHHGGVDYAAPKGTPVWAVASGRVRFAGRKGGYGNLVVLQHRDGVRTWYAHLSRIQVRKGARVSQKDVVGRVGSTGMSTGPHLHFGMQQGGGRFFDPRKSRGKRALALPAKWARAFREQVAPIAARLREVRVATNTTVMTAQAR